MDHAYRLRIGATMPAPKGITISAEPRVLFFHLKKTGGSTICAAFRKVLHAWPLLVNNCNCPAIGEHVRHGDGASVAAWMAWQNFTFCAVEEMGAFPSSADGFTRLKLTFPGKLVTSLREPLARVKSHLAMDVRAMAAHGHGGDATNLTLSAFTSHVGLPFNGMRDPDAYVRAFTGLHRTGLSEGPPAPLQSCHLRSAMQTLESAFDEVIILEQDSISDVVKRLSNNTAPGLPNLRKNVNVNSPEGSECRREADRRDEEEWAERNQLDTRLYEWAVSMSVARAWG